MKKYNKNKQDKKIIWVMGGSLVLLLVVLVLFLNQMSLNKKPDNKKKSEYTSSEDYKAGKKYSEDHPIVEKMPIIYAKYEDGYKKYTEFRIDAGKFENCKKDFCLKISDTTGGNYEKALEEIRKAGFEPKDFEIIYENKPIEPLE